MWDAMTLLQQSTLSSSSMSDQASLLAVIKDYFTLPSASSDDSDDSESESCPEEICTDSLSSPGDETCMDDLSAAGV